MLRLLLIVALTVTLSAAACGKKGALEPPEGAQTDRPRPGR
jgi:predicted small lipoprotein YifL